MISEIITQLKKEKEKQGVTEQRLANMAGLTQNKVHRIINGQTKKLDLEAIEKLRMALNLVSDQQSPAYTATVIHQALTPEENELLARYRRLDDQHRLQLMEIAVCYEGFCKDCRPAEPLVTDSTESGYGQKSSGGVGG